MRVTEHKGGTERAVLAAMVTDPQALARIAPKWPTPPAEGLFRTRWANLVGRWCVSYHRKYAGAPGRRLESMFARWSDGRSADKDTVDLLSTFLRGLSYEYEATADEQNTAYTLDLAGTLFRTIRLERLATSVDGACAAGDVDGAEAAVSGYHGVDLGSGQAVEVTTDRAALEAAFADQEEALVTYGGDLGKFFGNSLARASFVSLMAPEKRGKTWWLLDLAWQAMRQRRRTAFFSVGDMTEAQVLRRVAARAAGLPNYPRQVMWPKAIHIPEGAYTAEVAAVVRDYTEAVTARTAWEAMGKIRKKGANRLRLATYPAGTCSVADIDATLDGWAAEGWVVDVVVIDYADILAPPPGHQEQRHQTNATWTQLRALSQARHCLVVTATQTDAASYTQAVLTRSNFSDDKRKLAHVTGMVGINQSDAEKERGVMRLNWIARREAEYSERRCCHVAGCLSVGRPAIITSF